MDDRHSANRVDRRAALDGRTAIARGASILTPDKQGEDDAFDVLPVIGERYVVTDRVGEGGMGRVYRAWDMRLLRTVAIKSLKRRDSDTNAARLVREAQSMASLSHPNVLPVYDVEQDGRRTFIVMELVEGRTLREWLLQKQRAWPEILRAFAEAGRGLAAAHAAGFVHRDFKPDNVLVGNDGRIRVMDFGLARDEASTRTATSAEIGGAAPPTESTLTRDSVVVGTPRYMPPEQHCSTGVGPEADLYALCVALWEALTGSPPFSAAHHRALLAAKTRGPPAWPAGAPKVPRRILDAIRRGLSPDPTARRGQMGSLLDAIAIDPVRKRSRFLLALTGALVVAGIGIGGYARWKARAARCAGGSAHLADIWDPARRTEIEAAVLGVDAPWAEEVWARTEHELDRYTAEWRTAFSEACASSTIRRELSAASMDLRMACLDRAKTQLAALTGVLATADGDIVDGAHEMLAALPPLNRCADDEALRARVAPPSPEDRETVDAARAHLAAASAEGRAGRYEAALQNVEEAADLATRVDYEPLATEVALTRGVALDLAGRWTESEVALRRAVVLASRWDQREELQRAATRLVYVVGYRLHHAEHGLRYSELAVGLSRADAALEVEARNAIAAVEFIDGNHEAAAAEFRKVLALSHEALGVDHPTTARSHQNLSQALAELGRFEEAQDEAQRAHAVFAATLGATHPRTAEARAATSNVSLARGRFDEAETGVREAMRTFEAAAGPDHATAALLRGNLAAILNGRGAYVEAESEVRRALKVWRARMPSERVGSGRLHEDLAVALEGQGQLPGAEQEYRRVLALREQALGADHPLVARARENLGAALRAQGRFEAAEEQARGALSSQLRALGPDHRDVAISRYQLGATLRARGEPAAAEVELRQALKGVEATLGANHPLVAWVDVELAIALRRRGKLREGEAASRRAIEIFEGAGSQTPGLVAARSSLGSVLAADGRQAEAELELRSALAASKDVFGPDHPTVATALRNVAGIVLDRGDAREAEELARRALAIREAMLPPEHFDVSDARALLATTLLPQGRAPEALALARHAWAPFESKIPLPVAAGRPAFALAQARWETSRTAVTRARALDLARDTLALFERTSDSEMEEEVRSWLKQRGASRAN